jgi:surface antigen
MLWKIKAIPLAAALIALTTMSAPTHAVVDPFKGSGFVLDESDLALVKTAAGKLYSADGVEVGAVEEWSNPETGNHGTVKLIRKHEYKGLPCRRLQHDIKLKRITDHYRFTLDRCKVADGEWKILAR